MATKGIESQVGFILVKNGRVIGFELFDHPETFEKLRKDLYQKYALDIGTKGKEANIDLEAIMTKFLKELQSGKITRGAQEQNVGGENIYLETDELRGVFFQRGNHPIYVSVVRKD